MFSADAETRAWFLRERSKCLVNKKARTTEALRANRVQRLLRENRERARWKALPLLTPLRYSSDPVRDHRWYGARTGASSGDALLRELRLRGRILDRDHCFLFSFVRSAEGGNAQLLFFSAKTKQREKNEMMMENKREKAQRGGSSFGINIFMAEEGEENRLRFFVVVG